MEDAESVELKRCMFCPRTSSDAKISGEHAWPTWLRKHLRLQPGASVSLHLHNREPLSFKLSPSADKGLGIKVNDVCEPCNNGWMARLESRVRPHFSRMVGDPERLSLPPSAQKDIALWTYKTAMVFSRIGFDFCDDTQRNALRTTLSPPQGRPIIWIGAFVGTHAATAFDSLVYLNVTRGTDRSEARGWVFTMTVGHVALQLFDIEDTASLHPPRVGPYTKWEGTMVPIWPVRSNVAIEWPPRYVLDDSGLSALLDRWRPAPR